MSGNPFFACYPISKPITEENPCIPSPCGPNSHCHNRNYQAVCSCLMGYSGSPPNCRPECYSNSDCQQINECINNKCVNPCPGSCGLNALCEAAQHRAVCECPYGHTGNPKVYCRKIERPNVQFPPDTDPCRPSSCGLNANCKNVDGRAECHCLFNYIGSPPDCRPECVENDDCSNKLACINKKCEDPCPGSCGENAHCIVSMHIPNCFCNNELVGNPFFRCFEEVKPTPSIPPNPCEPSPCGSNAICRIRGSSFTCECTSEYIGNPYEGCRPECIGNSECPSNKACIRYKCVDPCPGTCGYSALCSVTNHIPTCSCPPGLTGNAFRNCEPIRRNDTIVETINPCYPSPCGLNSVCRVSNKNAICECIPGYFGDPTGQGCTPECTLSSDCTKDKTCVNFKCVDPCPGACGYGAQCQTINHNPICSCPAPNIGNPFVGCHPAEKSTDPCNPTPCKSNGICQVINEVATCLYPECVSNDDCPRDKTCSRQKCQDPCIHACGVNAICNAINHKATCSCPNGYYGSPYDKCYPQMEAIRPQDECTQDSDCPNDKSCINQQCQNPCAVSSRICGENAKCYVQNHRPLCVCNEGFTGNAHSYCFTIGCRSDDECPATESCINQKCLNPCTYTQCGINAICKADYNHRARCHCLEGYQGNPLEYCNRPECVNNMECPYNLACINERCQDPCKCGEGTECRVNNHIPQCRCLPGYTGNPQTQCSLLPKVTTECSTDAECPSKLACYSGNCKNPCSETHPCGANAICSVIDTLPLRTMVCQCETGYVGNADMGCRKEITKEPGCTKNDDCPNPEACRNGICKNPCIADSPCAKTAECTAKNHLAICRCPANQQGDPFINCYTPSLITPECTVDSDCSSSMACQNQRCQNPCAEANPCAGNAECRVSQHRPLCYCPPGWGGDPKLQCFKPECTINSDCPYDKACINEKCVNPCTFGTIRCGVNAQCKPENHHATCECPIGTQGNPFTACITGKCQYNSDCAENEACDRLNRVCKAVCDAETCATLATCYGINHQPVCECKPGTIGNPYVECLQSRQPVIPEPECTTDIECSPQLACINRKCSNPCAVSNVCSPQQTCTVLETLPLRTLVCTCPQDTITDNSRNCVPIKFDEGCRSNNDCTDPEICQRGQCIEACRLESCGINALCMSKNHYAKCSCPQGFTGNARIECTPFEIKPVLPTAECTRNDDCPNDRKCLNEKCINPCAESRSCGVDAYCHVESHQAICRCPQGYSGVPEINCRPLETPSLECESNSDCSLTNSCINGHCIDPCNCGQNAECFVRNHHPVCSCRPGYSGNGQNGCFPIGCQADDECSLDKQCVNQECINPCAINDPCAINAECYGRNHRATCKCPDGLEGDPFKRCDRVECHTDYDCPLNQGCINKHCVDLCQERNPCARNAICFVLNHVAKCKCPEQIPLGNPFAYCEERPPSKKTPECTRDGDCPSKLACINEKCVNPCKELTPCSKTAYCTVLDSVPVRTMVCECPEHFIPDINGECKPIKSSVTSGCSSNNECPTTEACINRQCRNPCNCGTNAICSVQNHRATCSCEDGHEGNPYSSCKTVGCRIDSECESGKACINGNCINPCLINDPCGNNAECFVQNNKAECRCQVGYRGNPYEGCTIIGCRTNSDCPSEKACVNTQCVNPCIYNNPCASHAECRPQNHIAICRCLVGYIGNPYIDCKKEILPECVYDVDCPSRLACINEKCKDPCAILAPCNRPAQCEVTPTSPVRTMICICPDGYISSGSGTCKPTTPIKSFGCLADSDCSDDNACVNGICRNPCNCGINAECRIKDHKPVCSCRQGYEGNAEFECVKVGCVSNSECLPTHSCINRQCVPACSSERDICGKFAECIGVNHRAVCECISGFEGNPRQACLPVGCRSNSDCPGDKSCINSKCQNPCEVTAVCGQDEICKVYNHKAQCTCPPGLVGTLKDGCKPEEPELMCKYDGDCPAKEACFRGDCLDPCVETHPCGVNTECRVLSTLPVRTMICECLRGYQGNAAVQCDKMSLCHIEKGFVRDVDGRCVCPPGAALDEYDYCVPCDEHKGYRIDESGHCICALERGFIIDERGRCICPLEYGYYLSGKGECIRKVGQECESNLECPDNRSCKNRLCIDPCIEKSCGNNAICNTTNHRPICTPINTNITFRTDFPRPDMVVSCLADGVQVEIHITEPGFNGVLYVKGHSKEEECRRVVNLSGDSVPRTELFKVHFGSCGLIHVNGVASFVLVIQKHPKLVTYKAQAYNIKCVYQTGEKNVTLGFNVSMLTTAGTIANTGPPPICQMRIVTHTGEEINSAEIGDNLVLQVDVEPATIYGGFARSCIAKTMEDNVENEYIVTDEDGCATDPTIFGEWDYNPETNSLLASFNAFKFPSSDNIRFQCNIRVCFGKCQPVNCRGYNAFGRRRRRREIAPENNIVNDSKAISATGDLGIEGQLREEITIQSNAILTFEKREYSGSDANIKPAAQRVEDICVSMVGLIIALVLTALLALVAVAVAVSCWLMAYRRRPKAIGPLPHPPEFPNPLFTNPDAVPEPTPDYLS